MLKPVLLQEIPESDFSFNKFYHPRKMEPSDIVSSEAGSGHCCSTRRNQIYIFIYIYIHTNMISSVCAIVSNRKGKYVYTLNIHYIIIMWYNQSMPAHQGGTHMNSCVHVQSSSYYRSELDLPRIWKENVSGLKVQCLPGDQMMYSMWILYIYI